MSHSFTKRTINGEEWNITHNGDFSGDATIIMPDADRVEYGRGYEVGMGHVAVTVPNEVLLAYAAKFVRDDLIGKLEEWGYDIRSKKEDQ